jgi:hypothetical protein
MPWRLRSCSQCTTSFKKKPKWLQGDTMIPQAKLRHDPLATDPWWYVPWLAGAIIILLVAFLLAFLLLI